MTVVTPSELVDDCELELSVRSSAVVDNIEVVDSTEEVVPDVVESNALAELDVVESKAVVELDVVASSALAELDVVESKTVVDVVESNRLVELRVVVVEFADVINSDVVESMGVDFWEVVES